ncbi:MAG TPA: glycosyltransferase family 4 protein [Armatimonadota bacterium]|nr:glycosyltransferase family 4 protein [Armatimonadota bacterium]
MKIAQLTYSYKPVIGGADAYADLLCQALRARGHEVWVYQRHHDADDSHVRQAPRWQARFRPRDFWLVPLWLKSQRQGLSGMDALIGHYPNYCSPAYWHPKLIGLSHGVTWDDAPDTWRARKKRRMARDAFERCARYVANDTFFLREIGLDAPPGGRAFEEVAPGRWFIPNCVDTERFSAPGGVEREPVIVVPRNIYRNRGIHLAVQAFSLVHEQFPEHSLEIVGAESQPAYAAEVKRMVGEMRLESRVRFTGSVAWEEMPRVYARSALCLIPSLCGEGTSLAALEAMACGCATVTTDAGGLTDLPAEHCRVDADDLARAMADALTRREAIAAEQTRRVRSEFHLGRWVEAWAKVVEDW